MYNNSNYCILQGEWHFLISGGTTVLKKLPNPASDWLSDRAWGEVLMLAALVRNIAKVFIQHCHIHVNVYTYGGMYV